MREVSQQLNHIKWPQKDNCCWFNINEVICKVDPQFPISNRGITLPSKDT